MNTLPLMIGVLCFYALAYRFYSAFLAAKVMTLDDRRITPAHLYEDHHNYVPSPKWVLFGHHFAAIAGAGPLVGPTLAAQFGFAPGLIWLLVGAVLAGCVQDFTILVCSIRHKGQSLAEIARTEISTFAGHSLGRTGYCRGQCLGRKSMGRVHHRHDDPHCLRHGLLHV
jgi:carbon starvation protein